MCLIMVSETGRPKEEYIINAESMNSDGIGIAWSEGDFLQYRKGLSIEETVELSQTLPLGFIIHFRMASVGGKSKDLIHPFPVRLDVPLKDSGKSNKLLFHNGHWSEWKDTLINHLSAKAVLPKGIWSDTRALAFLTAMHGKSFLTVVKHAGKFALMTPQRNSLIGDWELHEGVHYSNCGYKWSYGGAHSHYNQWGQGY